MRYLFALDPNNYFFGSLEKWILSIEDVTLCNTVTIIFWVVCAVIAYLLGSLNSAIIVSRYKFKQDIRSFGSGNAGLTNMHRVYGKDGAVWTLLGDIAKQLVSVLIGSIMFGRMGAYLAGAFCMIGHIFPVYYRFKGGKGARHYARVVSADNLEGERQGSDDKILHGASRLVYGEGFSEPRGVECGDRECGGLRHICRQAFSGGDIRAETGVYISRLHG